MPSGPSLGRECQCPHPGSPRSAREIRIHLCSAGAASICSSSGDPLGKGVAHPLELLEARDPRLGEASRHACVELQSRESLGPEAAKLVFEAADLAAQLDPREALIASHPKRAERLSFEQIWHRPNRV
jgi:hypothetical protein